jgi:hypothetical protein
MPQLQFQARLSEANVLSFLDEANFGENVLICEYSSAYDICKAKASALRAALHISPAYAQCGLSEINQQLQHAAEKLKNTILAV